MPPDKKRHGSQVAEPGSRPKTSAAAKQAGSPVRILKGSGVKRQQAPLAPASVFGPVGRRKSWWYTYRCRICGAHLFGRAKTLDAVTGERRAGCGHRITVMAARIYTQPEPGAVA